jgi:predicted ATPase
MLDSLSLTNFKSWAEVKDLRLGKITGFFGTNSSGKTSLLQLILLLKQTAEASDRSLPLDLGDEKSMVELGTFRDVLHGHDLSKSLEWSLRWTLPKALVVADPDHPEATLFQGSDIRQTGEVAWRNSSGPGRMFTRRIGYTFADRTFAMKQKSESREKYDLTARGANFEFKRSGPGRAWPLPAPVKSYGFPDQVRGYFRNAGFLSDLELAFENLLKNVFYLGPLREYPRRQYTWAGGNPSDMGRRGEKVVDALLASRDRGKTIKFGRGRGAISLTVEEQVGSWLKDLGLVHSFEVHPVAADSKLYEVMVRRSEHSAPVLITDVGFGVSQILPVLTLCYYAPKGATLIFEQPEIHLHPSVQAGLADVFIHAAKVRGVQIILESHSEHLLRRLQRRIAEEAITSDETALYFSHMAGDRSEITPLELDLFGSIKNWPKDFFGDELGEVAATQQAILNRKRGRS